MKQLNHYNTNFTKQTFPIILVCDNITSAPNIGSLFRTADAFGIEKIIFCGSPIPSGRKMTKTSRATEKVVLYEEQESILTVIEQLKANNHQIISLEITNASQSLKTFIKPKQQKIALVIGDENFGVSEAVLNLSDTIIHIDMFGQNSSMNVVQATSIALYEITKQALENNCLDS
ncbi:TrmH family RNA methyltransferase [Xanthomarina sp. F1114]|uniref:TrmH family RNA methyltransferase n=1 Tax=Xanthomarina sp. F1114 TaxID=2996019 RepID=UPI00225E0AF1|nr:TrmH family RNA methyltransferase [Xanthomarina sp. F1114]MCX7548029.1 TrmH family RNA methyltransferase [Xanthomarina sp. F1114]